MTDFQEGQWVSVNWKRVYPPMIGQVSKQSGEVTTVIIPTLGTIDFPTNTLIEADDPRTSGKMDM